ncbi:response regulator transcription factor [Altererythrobacter sp. Root672]|uniref:response regulator transcription factor n=1 Tax=Altererythrobacter sp. Root672 TaxID=1736584 RepID=UPI0006F94194|nr:response regulator [Altererythrobacter sp. Root672]KRA81195.1 two-component system response regulator [Altererythrobacter sp. Root672]
MTKRLVYLVDDDNAVRRAVSFMLRTADYDVTTFKSGDEFVKESDTLSPGCVLLDVRMPGIDGLEAQRLIAHKGSVLPVVIMTGHGDIAMAVQAMKSGAVDFLEKPFEKAMLVSALEQGWLRLEKSDRLRLRSTEAAAQLEILSPRERDVLNGMVEGLPNKAIAHDLGISPRTVEIHRANVMSKLGVKSLSEALRLAFAATEKFESG